MHVPHTSTITFSACNETYYGAETQVGISLMRAAILNNVQDSKRNAAKPASLRPALPIATRLAPMQPREQANRRRTGSCRPPPRTRRGRLQNRQPSPPDEFMNVQETPSHDEPGTK
jgi:hypothetical protein